MVMYNNGENVAKRPAYPLYYIISEPKEGKEVRKNSQPRLIVCVHQFVYFRRE